MLSAIRVIFTLYPSYYYLNSKYINVSLIGMDSLPRTKSLCRWIFKLKSLGFMFKKLQSVSFTLV